MEKFISSKKAQSKAKWFLRLGYAFFFTILLIALGLLAFSVFYISTEGISFGSLKLAGLTALLSFFMFKSFFIFDKFPNGKHLNEEEAKPLWDLIEETRKTLNAPKLDHVILTNEFNAFVSIYSPYGLLGPKKNLLAIGVPLLSTLSEKEFQSVIAHEFAHISHGDTKIGAKMYHVIQSWIRLYENISEQGGFTSWLVRKFLNWYIPKLDEMTYPMRQAEEYAADEKGMNIAGKEAAMTALMKVYVYGTYYHSEYLNELFDQFKKTNSKPTPIGTYFEYASRLEESKLKRFLDNSLREETNYEDTHPCLKDRLIAIDSNYKSLNFSLSDKTALKVLIPEGKKLINELDTDWLDNNEQYWSDFREELSDRESRYEQLKTRSILTDEELVEKISLVEQFESFDTSIPLYEQLSEQTNNLDLYADAQLNLAWYELHQDNDEAYHKGHERIDWALNEWDYRLHGLSLLAKFYDANGYKEVEEIVELLEEWEEVLEKYQETAFEIGKDDELISHDLETQSTKKIVNLLKKYPVIHAAYLTKLYYFEEPEKWVYHLILDSKKLTEEQYEEITNSDIWESLQINEDIFVHKLDGKLRKKLENLEDSIVFEKETVSN